MTNTTAIVSVGGQPRLLRVSLILRGADLDPDEISRLLQCPPDSSHRRGEPRKSGKPYPDGMWEIELAGDGDSSLGNLIERLLNRVPPHANWDAVSPTCQVTLGLYTLFVGDNHDFVIPAEQLARLARIGAEFWCDVYVDSSS